MQWVLTWAGPSISGSVELVGAQLADCGLASRCLQAALQDSSAA